MHHKTCTPHVMCYKYNNNNDLGQFSHANVRPKVTIATHRKWSSESSRLAICRWWWRICSWWSFLLRRRPCDCTKRSRTVPGRPSRWPGRWRWPTSRFRDHSSGRDHRRRWPPIGRVAGSNRRTGRGRRHQWRPTGRTPLYAGNIHRRRRRHCHCRHCRHRRRSRTLSRRPPPAARSLGVYYRWPQVPRAEPYDARPGDRPPDQHSSRPVWNNTVRQTVQTTIIPVMTKVCFWGGGSPQTAVI